MMNDPVNPIKRARESIGMTQAKLALCLKVTQSYISQIELGVRFPSVSFIKKLGAILDLEPEKFLSAYGNPTIREAITDKLDRFTYAQLEKVLDYVKLISKAR